MLLSIDFKLIRAEVLGQNANGYIGLGLIPFVSKIKVDVRF